MRKSISLLASAGFAVLPVIGHAATPTLSDVLGASGITESGYIDAGYSASNFNSVNNLGAPNSNSFTLNQVNLTLAKQPTEGFGGLVDVSLGNDATAINGSYGDTTSNFAVTQAFVQYATGGLTVMGGRFLAIAGEESVNQTQDANATRSILFSLQPVGLTGARATYKINNQVSVIGGLSNTAFAGATETPGGSGLLVLGLNQQSLMAVDANPQKAIELGVTFAPMSNLSLALSHYRETSGTGPGGRPDLTDFVANYQPLKALSLGLNADYLHVPNGSGTGSVIKGAALYVGYQFCDQLKGTLRGEYVQALNIFGSGSTARAKELTYTVDYTAAKNFNLLAEYRYDHGDSATSGKALGSTVTARAIYSF